MKEDMTANFREYLDYLPSGMKLYFESGDECVVLMPPTGQGFHDWYYYILDHAEKGIRIVRRHRMLPELFPIKEVLVEGDLSDDDAVIVKYVWEQIGNDQLKPMGDCAK